MITDQPEPKYDRVIAYIRKSSEDSKNGKPVKQINSLPGQRNFLKEALDRYELKLLRKPFADSKSGYKAFEREGFDEMLDYLRDNKGKVDGIVCTEISRLARNLCL